MDMKATGIVRRIDDLGRVVIPKEIRRTMRIREGDPLEIYTEKDGEVIFKKYSPMGELSDFAEQICESMHKTAEYPTAVCDRDGVIAAAGSGRRELLDRRISAELMAVMEGRRAYRAEPGGKTIPLTDGENSPKAAVAVPILSEGDVLGCVVMLERGDGVRTGDTEMKLAATVAGFLGKQMES
ncbi:MAG: AbrB/MazE/SpoVT family DNA-binding domain-containing protein [Oscillospiraceae bacterium]|nr:AbrB/MazE/SpoVT family DNA-binding domain-containing protein [Oscillospiraceae bacterium]